MTGPVRPCGNPRCHTCYPRPPEPPAESAIDLVIGGLALAFAGYLALVLAPILAGPAA